MKPQLQNLLKIPSNQRGPSHARSSTRHFFFKRFWKIFSVTRSDREIDGEAEKYIYDDLWIHNRQRIMSNPLKYREELRLLIKQLSM